MPKRFSSGALVFLLLIGSLIGSDKEKKAYELIYRDIQVLKQQILQIEKKIDENRSEISQINEQISELLALTRFFQKEQAGLKEDQRKIPVQFQTLLQKLDVITNQLGQFSDSLGELKQAAVASGEQIETQGETGEEPVPAQRTPDETRDEGPPEESDVLPNLSPQEVYNMAYSDYLKGNFQLAIDGFQIYLDNFKDSPVADNALYWIGECYYSQGDFDSAIERFDQLLLSYPSGDKIPAAYLKKGLSLIELGKKEEALTVLKILVSKYPLEEETKIAQQKIKDILDENERYQ